MWSRALCALSIPPRNLCNDESPEEDSEQGSFEWCAERRPDFTLLGPGRPGDSSSEDSSSGGSSPGGSSSGGSSSGGSSPSERSGLFPSLIVSRTASLAARTDSEQRDEDCDREEALSITSSSSADDFRLLGSGERGLETRRFLSGDRDIEACI